MKQRLLLILKPLCIVIIALLSLTGCYVIKKPSVNCTPAKDLHLNGIELRRLQWFVARAQRDSPADLKYNHLSCSCFKPEIVNADNVGLIRIWRRGHPHEGVAYFINGKKSITPLRFGTPVSPVRFDQPEPSAEEKRRVNKKLEKALARYADEIDDSLKYRIIKALGY